jgi:hypothetical protein
VVKNISKLLLGSTCDATITLVMAGHGHSWIWLKFSDIVEVCGCSVVRGVFHYPESVLFHGDGHNLCIMHDCVSLIRVRPTGIWTWQEFDEVIGVNAMI